MIARVAAALAAWLACAAWAGPPPTDAARVAFLVERIGNLQAQRNAHLGGDRPRRALAQASRDMDHALATAARDAPASMREHYALFGLLWRQHRAWLQRPGAREAAAAQRERDDELAWLADRGRGMAGVPPSAEEEAWQVARLSQRVARLAILRRALPSAGEALGPALDELRERLAALQARAAGREGFEGEVAVARGQVDFLLRAVAQTPFGAREADVAARSADHAAEALERALARLSASPG